MNNCLNKQNFQTQQDYISSSSDKYYLGLKLLRLGWYRREKEQNVEKPMLFRSYMKTIKVWVNSVSEVLCCTTNTFFFSVAFFHFTENSGSKLSLCGSEMKLESKMKMSGWIFLLLWILTSYWLSTAHLRFLHKTSYQATFSQVKLIVWGWNSSFTELK